MHLVVWPQCGFPERELWSEACLRGGHGIGADPIVRDVEPSNYASLPLGVCVL
eukprot:SAG11_NODE_1418_length_4962_cov_3.782644_1_plen_53_part_00